MYIYDLPFDTNKELCRILDIAEDWKELAGVMKYSAFQVMEIENMAKINSVSPTQQLFTNWGQLNHRVEEMFILLYRLKHIPALKCLIPLVDSKYHELFKKLCPSGIRERETSTIEDKANKKPKLPSVESQGSSLPLPVVNIPRQPAPPPSSLNGTPTEDDSTDMNSMTSQDSRDNDIRAEIMRNVAAIPKLSYEELVKATNNWSAANHLGRGGFANVYKGEWKELTVAVKRLRGAHAWDKELIRELCLNQYRHDNIVPLYGYSYGGAEVCLVYQLMCGGTLEQRLHRRTSNASRLPPLTWAQRHRIAHGVARGLQFLHTMSGTPLIHGDIKPANILLDQCLIPKISDFGLARKGPYGNDRTHVKVSSVHGTRPYLPDEYVRSRCLSPAVDVFSYGVVMLEIATCLKLYDPERSVGRLPDFIRVEAERGVDVSIYEDKSLIAINDSNPQVCKQFIDIGIHCTKCSRFERPSMLEVYKKLDAMVVACHHIM